MNKIKRYFNKIKRNRIRVSKDKLIELRDKCEKQWIERPDIIGICHSDKKIVIFRDKNKVLHDTDDAFDAYTDSPLEIIETEPFKALDWQNKEDNSMKAYSSYSMRPFPGGVSIGHKNVSCGTAFSPHAWG